jgi:hypothetical protein
MKRKFNWVDIVIVALIAIVIYGGYSYILKPKGVAIDKVPVEITFRVDGVLIETVNGINVGDIFKDKENNQIIGEVIKKDVTEAYDFVETGDGRVVKSKLPNKYSVYITIKGNAVITDDYIRVGDRDMRIEGTIFLKSNVSAIKSTITDIKILE